MNTTTIVLISLIVFLRFIYPLIRNRNFIKYKSLLEIIETNPKLLILDVRTRGEYNSGHIPSAKNISHEKLPNSLPKIKKDAIVVVYCRSGQRAKIGKKALEGAGFTNVKNFGGLSRWKGELKS